MRRNLVAMPLSATQLALVAMAAKEAFIMDPERHWLPPEFQEEFRGALRAIDALTRMTFGLCVQAHQLDAEQRMCKTAQCQKSNPEASAREATIISALSYDRNPS